LIKHLFESDDVRVRKLETDELSNRMLRQFGCYLKQLKGTQKILKKCTEIGQNRLPSHTQCILAYISDCDMLKLVMFQAQINIISTEKDYAAVFSTTALAIMITFNEITDVN
jgi:hypothetical protein